MKIDNLKDKTRVLSSVAIIVTLLLITGFPVSAVHADTGTLQGVVTDATNGNPIVGATVSIDNLNAVTNSSGEYLIEQVPVGMLVAEFEADVQNGSAPLTVQFSDNSTDGTQTVTASAAGYNEYVNRNVTITANTTLTMDISLSPNLSAGQMRIVLNWAADPRDLDSHLLTPDINGSSYHVYFGNQGSADSAPFVTLDHDVTGGYGPETITLYDFFTGTYTYYIYKYAGTGEIIESDAVVQVYNESGLLETIYAPTSGSGLYWHVLDIDGNSGTVTVVNTIGSNAPNAAKQNVIDETTMSKSQITLRAPSEVQSWNWNFGDGSSSTEQNPVYTYQNPGTYTVSLTVSNGDTSVITTKTDYITAEGAQTGSLEGTITDATTGDPIEGATVSVAGLSDQTDANGDYLIENVPVGMLTADFSGTPTAGGTPLAVQFTDLSTDGSQTVIANATGYNQYVNRYVMILPSQSVTLDISLSPELSEGSMRFVLNWNAEPRDLDSHLLTPEIEGNTYHIYYSNRGSGDSAPYAALDHDVTNGYGPETVTIYNFFDGVYRYYIYKYAGDGEITTSNGVVQIYTDTGLLHTIQAPTSGEGRYWHVCDINGATQEITIVDTIGSVAPSASSMNAVVSIPDKKFESITPRIPAEVLEWNWNFGDGSTSTEQNPQHIYGAAGSYTVSLTVSNSETSVTEVKANYIVAENITVSDTLLNESFEGTLENWYTYDNDQDGDTWTVYQELAPPDTVAHSGVRGIGTFYNTSGNDDWIVTPAIPIPSEANNVVFKFWAHSLSTNYLEDFNVLLSTAGNAMADFSVTLAEVTDVPGGWTEYTYDLTDYSGESVYLAVQCVSVDDYYLFADDFLVVAERPNASDPEIAGVPTEYALHQNYPNPFNPSTRIRYELPVSELVTVQIFDIQGHLVRTLVNEYQMAGIRECLWNGRADSGNLVSTGLYYYRLQTDNYTQVKKMVYMK